MRPLSELIDEADSALPRVHEWVQASDAACEILPPSADSDRVLLELQVTTRSTLGAVAHGTGGVLVDHGWLRFLGAGHPRLTRNLADWNKGRSSGFLLVADDAAGGFFAINGGALGANAGDVCYFAPDTLEWESLDLGYTDFFQWSLSERLQDFYADLRWPGWQADMDSLAADQGFGFYPFLWTEQGSPLTSTRKAIDVAELHAFAMDHRPV